ncbi:fasciclin domain-containing protein [Tamlana sp. 2201CG12-4]|uniref:fasciclin domain-containing protein n=1 Tax=Tamlana sp. 2201CG12-4 TaxID=3112582 RepID=UPI002DB64B68|nr:fasciclin domain-containing protein [Tamlana sp. 2201CG12-4]MEC3907212.1 fasciclin domain-containing protein [Tamlana sp. 2201CG12-4]
MKNLKNIISIGILSILIMMGCQDKEWDKHYEESIHLEASSLVEYLKNNDEYSEFYELLKVTKLDSIVQNSTNVTLFVVKNDNIPDEIHNENVDDLKKRLKLHMLHGKYYAYRIEENERLKTLNGKYLEVHVADNSTISDVSFLPKDLSVGNGVIQELESILAPVPNVYEYLYSLGDEYSIVQEYLKGLDKRTFDKENSKPIGVNEQGNTVYDSIWVIKNKLLEGVNDVREEDNLYTAFYPTNNVVTEAITKVREDYAASGGDLSPELDAELFEWTVTSLYTKGIVENPMDMIVRTTNNDDFWISPGKQEIINDSYFKASNGIVYTVTHLHVPKIKYMNKFVFDPKLYWMFDQETRDQYMYLEEGERVYFMQRGGGYEPAWGYGWYGIWGAENRDVDDKDSYFKVKFPYSTIVTEDDELKVVSLIPGEYEVYGQSGITRFGIWNRPSWVQLYINDVPMEEKWQQWSWVSNVSPIYLGTIVIPEEAGTNPISISVEVLDRSPNWSGSGGARARNRAFIKIMEFIPTKTNY